MRVGRLPPVLRARGRAPLPADWHRRRPGLRLLALGVVVTVLAGLGLCAVGYGALAVALLVVGPRDDAAGFAALAVACAAGAAVGPRVRTALVRWWMAADEEDRSTG